MQRRDDDSATGRVLTNAAANWPALSERIPGVAEHWTNTCTASAITHHAVASGTAGLWRIACTPRDENAAPVAIIVKRISPVTGDFSRWQATSDPSDPFYWGREALAYETGFFGDAWTGIRAAHCYLVDRHDDAIDLYLEDVSGSPGGTWELERYVRAAERLGRY
ncbi:MAG: hypothetical protein M3154_10000, partial [Candidatus Eremiobacteraeota bacterium]|nr:hypothetical protein [Candidatus Eremiobacteraeota bacterium]